MMCAERRCRPASYDESFRLTAIARRARFSRAHTVTSNDFDARVCRRRVDDSDDAGEKRKRICHHLLFLNFFIA